MLQGKRAQLHRGSCCYVKAPGKGFDNEIATVLEFNDEKEKWHVRLMAAQWKKKELLLPESALKLGFSLLPSSVSKFETYVRLDYEGSQGTCGRGLVAAMQIKAGWPVFEEAPFIVCRKDATSMEAHHAERWMAFRTLEANAKASENYAQALAAFWELGFCEEVPAHVSDGAAAIVKKSEAAMATPLDAAQREKERKYVTEVLMRFHANQFGFFNASQGTDTPEQWRQFRARYEAALCDAVGSNMSFVADFLASALYANTSRVNHCCDPSIATTTKKQFCLTHKIKFNFESDAGVKMAYAKRDIAPGERLTINYGPDELVAWSLEERRKVLHERFAFVCGCERCVAEEEALKMGIELIGSDSWRGVAQMSEERKADPPPPTAAKAAAKADDDIIVEETGGNGKALEEVEEEAVDEVPDFVEDAVEKAPAVEERTNGASDESAPAAVEVESTKATTTTTGEAVESTKAWVAAGLVVVAAVAVMAVLRVAKR